MAVRLYLAGRICVEAGGRILDERRFPGRQGRLVFVYLAAERHRAVSRDELIEELWGDAPPPSEDRSLNAIVSKLRGLFSRLDAPGLEIAGAFGGYQVQAPADVWIDLEAAADGLDRAEGAMRRGGPLDAWAWAQVAYQVSQRPFLAGEDGPWVTRKRAELRDTLLRALDCLCAAYLCNEEPALAVRHGQRIVELDPFRETGYQHLIRAHAAAGNRAQALQVYEGCRRLLAEELGVPPSPQTEAVYLEVLRA